MLYPSLYTLYPDRSRKGGRTSTTQYQLLYVAVFGNDSLPTTPPDISAFARNSWRLVFTDGSGRARIQGSLSTLTAVPLPAAAVLFGAGLVALIGLGAGSWRQKKNSLA